MQHCIHTQKYTCRNGQFTLSLARESQCVTDAECLYVWMAFMKPSCSA